VDALVVEDDPRVASLLVRLLAERGFGATVAQSRSEAFFVLATGAGRFALACVDLALPDGSGLDVLVELRRGGARVPAILATGSIDQPPPHEGVLLRKPFTLEEFSAAVDVCLAAGRA
jgi:DNA-binding response OmpR family regulator